LVSTVVLRQIKNEDKAGPGILRRGDTDLKNSNWGDKLTKKGNRRGAFCFVHGERDGTTARGELKRRNSAIPLPVQGGALANLERGGNLGNRDRKSHASKNNLLRGKQWGAILLDCGLDRPAKGGLIV